MSLAVRPSVPCSCAAPIAIGLALAALAPSARATLSTISSNFNGTAIAAGNTVWFNSVFTASGVGSTPAHLFVRNASITFTTFTLTVPDADITIDPAGGTGTTSVSAGRWQTTVRTGLSGNEFLSGLSFLVPAGGLPGGINPVAWSADFTTDTPGLSLNWKWGAAAYTNFSSDYNLLGVKPTDDANGSGYNNSDHAGTPENFKTSVIGGARGGGGSNFTGSYSGTEQLTPGASTVPLPTAAGLGALGLALAGTRRRR